MATATQVLVTNAGLLRGRFSEDELRALKVYALMIGASATTVAGIKSQVSTAKGVMAGLPDKPGYEVSDAGLWGSVALSGVTQANILTWTRSPEWAYVKNLDPDTLRMLEIYLTGVALSAYT